MRVFVTCICKISEFIIDDWGVKFPLQGGLKNLMYGTMKNVLLQGSVKLGLDIGHGI